MMGKTHRLCGALAASGGYLFLRYKGMLQPGIDDYVQLLVMYPFAYYGAVFPDIDHNSNSSPCKDPISKLLNVGLHLYTPARKKIDDYNPKAKKSFAYKVMSIFDARHRSWQTHSELPIMLVLWLWMTLQGGIEAVILAGFLLGYLSHFIMDLITPAGWNLASGMFLNSMLFNKKVLPEKISLVPNIEFFRTGGKWETLWYGLLSVLSLLVTLGVLLLLIYEYFNGIRLF